MRHLHVLTFLLALIFSASAFARASEPQAMRYPLGTLLDGVALNDATPANRTLTVLTDGTQSGYGLLVLYVDHTNSNASTVDMTCTNKPTATDTAATLQDCTIDAGECESDDASWSKSVSASKAWPWRVNISGFPGRIECVLSGTSADGSDLVSIKGWLVTL